MTFRNYVKSLANHLAKYPDSAELEVVYSSYNEGNKHYKVILGPLEGKYDQAANMFVPSDTSITDPRTNAICIN